MIVTLPIFRTQGVFSAGAPFGVRRPIVSKACFETRASRVRGVSSPTGVVGFGVPMRSSDGIARGRRTVWCRKSDRPPRRFRVRNPVSDRARCGASRRLASRMFRLTARKYPGRRRVRGADREVRSASRHRRWRCGPCSVSRRSRGGNRGNAGRARIAAAAPGRPERAPSVSPDQWTGGSRRTSPQIEGSDGVADRRASPWGSLPAVDGPFSRKNA